MVYEIPTVQQQKLNYSVTHRKSILCCLRMHTEQR